LQRPPAAVTLEMLIVPHRGELWRHIVAFRDRLRRDPSAARTYYRLKVASRTGATGYWEAKRRYQAIVGS
jgi:hypothetical protein